MRPILALSALALVAPAAKAQTPLVERFEWLSPSACGTPQGAAGVNAAGDVVVTCRSGFFPDFYFEAQVLPFDQSGLRATFEFAKGIDLNTRGDVVGVRMQSSEFTTSIKVQRLIAQGVRVDLRDGEHDVQAAGIDRSGAVWGTVSYLSQRPDGQIDRTEPRPFRLAHPAATPRYFSLPSGARLSAVADGGLATAWWFDCNDVGCEDQVWRAFLLRPDASGAVTVEEVPTRPDANPTTVIFGVNDRGQFVGETSTSFGGFTGAAPAFFYNGRGYVTLPLLPSDGGYATASALTNDSLIVGYSRDCDVRPTCDRAVVWTVSGTASTVHSLDALASGFLSSGSFLTEALDISETRWIVGLGFDAATNRTRFYRLKLVDPLTITVNDVRDLPDLDPSDGACDVSVDPGLQCTFRAAIQESNARPRRQTIVFNISGESGTPQIDAASVLPTVTDSVSINARTQPGAGTVRLDGSLLGGLADGLVLDADSVEIEGLTITRFGGFGVAVEGGRGVYLRSVNLGQTAFDGQDTTLANAEGALRLLGTPERVVIGRSNDDPLFHQTTPNRFLGAISIDESARAGVEIRLANRFRLLPSSANAATAALVDLDGDGPTCAAWTPTASTDPTPPPRILHQPNDGSGATAFEGIATPGSRVVLWNVRERAHGHGRYFAQDAEAVAEAIAGSDGRFAVDASLSNGERFTVSATAPGRGVSELAQARRPVVALPGIGGSTLVDRFTGESHWLPVGLLPNDRLAGMALDPDGLPNGRVVTGGVVEPLGKIYGEMMTEFGIFGYVGDPQNANPTTLDLWRFANDWRLSPGLLADSLQALVLRLTDATATPGDAARSCDVDLAAHSNGGVIAGVYVQRDRAHSRNRVHRFVTSGTPYLGAVQALAGQTIGYVFEFEKSAPLLFPFDVEWGRMLTMTQNIPGAYMLLPSPNYYAASDPAKGTNRENTVLVDLYNNGLDAHATVRTFLGDRKVDDAGIPLGLARNTPLFDEQTALHALLGDWRTYDGPPQIYRLVGDLPVSTAVAWRLGLGPEHLPPGSTLRDHPGDTDRHRAYRERLQPILGFGDGTVPLVSATLGRDRRLGRQDFSGVDESRWIEEFERFGCHHLPLVEPGCPSLEGGPDALSRLVEIVLAGNSVRFNNGGGGARAARSSAEAAAQPRDVLYLAATARLRVAVVDGSNRLTGRADTSTFVSRQIPDVDFDERTLGATIGLDPSGTYTVEAVAPDGGTVYPMRVAMNGDGETGTQALFPGVALQPGGRMRLVYTGGSLALSTPWQVDTTGDGSFEATSEPAATLSGGAAPLVPLPLSARLVATGHEADTTARIVTLRLPASGAGWTWSLGALPDWIEADTVSGTAPATVRLRFRAAPSSSPRASQGASAAKTAAALPQGTAADTLALTLQNGTFSYETPLFVQFDVGAPLPVELVAFAGRADGTTARLAWTTASETNNVGFVVERRQGDAWAAVSDLIAGHGTTTETHVYTFDVPDLAPGRHTFRLRQLDTDGTVAFSPETTVEIGFEGAFFASAVYPSPVRGAAAVRVVTTAPDRLRAEVYDVLGRRVALVHDGPVMGETVFRLDAHAWRPGVYVLRLTMPSATVSRPFTVAR
ncbi:MAG: hypothetical protein LCH53_00635 [Bacteroidetes bacterium]|nr:hypothetical protein [Bacteroidota bacterium]